MTAQFDDILFALRAVGAAELTNAWDIAEAERVLGAYAEFIEADVAPTSVPGDREGCRVENGRVRTPVALPALYRTYVDLGWQLLPLPDVLGGFGAPAVVGAAATEMLASANHAFQMLVSLVPGAVRAIERFGSAALKEQFLPDLTSGTALATMCLTEPGAGSDLGAIRTRAVRGDDNAWELEGEKIFISGGDQDLSLRITHLVLARTGPPDSGTKGLSLFVCSSQRPDGTPNQIRLVRIEEKLGLHASPTCQLRFEGAAAELLGEPGDGLKAMFVMMDHTRLDVAVQGVAHAAHAHRLASAYAAERVQGGRPIVDHGDVRRMLLEMEALTMGSRAMAYRAAITLQDAKLAAFLTPVCKVFCTEAATAAADLGIQVLGGYGYLPEYGIEQIWREARVTRIYEGTNGILSMSLAKRLLGAHAEAFLQEIDEAATLAPSEQSSDALAMVRNAWREARQAVAGARDPSMAAFPLMRLAGLLFFAASWIRLEAAAPESKRLGILARFVRDALLPEAKTLQIRCEALSGEPG